MAYKSLFSLEYISNKPNFMINELYLDTKNCSANSNLF